MSIWKIVVAALLTGCLAVFILQNRELLELRFLGWTFETRRAFLLLTVFGFGLATGWALTTISQLRARGRDEAARASRRT